MTSYTTRTLAFLLAGLAIAACSGDKKPEAAATKSGATAAAAPAAEWKKLDKLGLQIEVAADSTVLDASADAANASIFDERGCKVSVNTVTPVYTSSYDNAVKEVEADPGTKFAAWTKKEQTPDGWHFEWTAKSMFDDATLHCFQVRRKVGGKEIECSEKLESAAGLACAVKACASLKPL